MGTFGASGGWVLTLGLGIGGGLVLTPALKGPPPSPTLARSVAPDGASIHVVEASGRAWAERPEGGARALANGDELDRPAALLALGRHGHLALRMASTQLQLGDDARLLLASSGPRALLERGRLSVSHPAPFEIDAPQHGLQIRGRSFGVWLEPERPQVASLEGRTEIIDADGAERMLEGPGLALLGDEIEFLPLHERLEVEVIEVRRLGSSTRVMGRSNPGSRVRIWLDERETEETVGSSGRFALQVPGRRGELEVEARDALGRIARPDEPSSTLAQVLASLESSSNGHVSSPE